MLYNIYLKVLLLKQGTLFLVYFKKNFLIYIYFFKDILITHKTFLISVF